MGFSRESVRCRTNERYQVHYLPALGSIKSGGMSENNIFIGYHDGGFQFSFSNMSSLISHKTAYFLNGACLQLHYKS